MLNENQSQTSTTAPTFSDALKVTAHRRRLAVAVGLVIFLSLTALGAKHVFYDSVRASVTDDVSEVPSSVAETVHPTPSKATTAATPPNEQQMTAELLVITPRGFEPNVVRRPPGRVLLALVNDAEFPLMTLRLQREDGTPIRTVEMQRNRRYLNIPITLEAGRYRIVDLTRPDLAVNLDITGPAQP